MRVRAAQRLLVCTILIGIAGSTTAGAAVPKRHGPAGVNAVPLFARIRNDHDLRAYTVPLTVNVSVHKIIFTFHRALNGNVRYSAPSHVVFDGSGVPKQFKSLFGDLGTPLTWQKRYALHVTGRTRQNGVSTYTLEGVPRKPSQVQSLAIQTTVPSAPIQAKWSLQGGWDVSATLYEQNQRRYLLPKQAQLDIVGHGYKIHAAMLYGAYALERAPRIAHARKKVIDVSSTRRHVSSAL